MNNPALLYAIAALCSTIVAAVYVLALKPKPGLLEQRLGESGTFTEEKEPQSSFAQRVLVPGLNRIGKVILRFSPAGDNPDLATHLELVAWNINAETFNALRVISMFGGLAAGLLVSLFMGFSPVEGLIFMIIFTGMMRLLPDMRLRSALRKREALIQKDLPNVIDLIKTAVNAGLGFDLAVARVCERPGDLSIEFQRALNEIRLGRPRLEALQAMADRNKIGDLTEFIGSVIRASKMGTELTNVLEIQSKEMRHRRLSRAEEASQRAPIKMMFPMVGCMLPPTFLMLLGPAVVKLVFNAH